jgi:hypothetical protein
LPAGSQGIIEFELTADARRQTQTNGLKLETGNWDYGETLLEG